MTRNANTKTVIPTNSPKIGMISFTGSVETGSEVMGAAVPHLTKVNLELGGKAPALVMADADLDLAVEAVKSSRLINSGQVCNCVERVYVDTKIADEFTAKLVVAMQSARFGDPNQDETLDYGPMINEEGFQKVDSMVAEAKSQLLFRPWMIAVPGAALVLLIFAINLVGDALRDVTTPEGKA